MKTSMATCLSVIVLITNFQLMAATQVEVQWQNPEKYRDVRPASESRKQFRESTFKKLDAYLQELSSKLPDGSKLLMTVTDLDLAGQVWPASFTGLGRGSSDIRVIKDVDIPRMTFNYQLMSNTGEILKGADVDLKDMSFLSRTNHRFRRDTLGYEKSMLKRWFDKEFSEQITQKVMEKGISEADS
ncbi:DUF3016 domain-containing protein [Paraglaciecola marina]|uniref:DUF3016 domain-containing protein n=1 Tax=Paraglaciecola marina TaxID=2500157 RepID=UPI00105FC1E5|nr:DUF3016 domain-containing protein [Paraglaciecola marina]